MSRRGKAFVRTIAAIQARPIGAELPVPRWKQELEWLRRNHPFTPHPRATKTEPPTPPSKAERLVLRGYLIAGVYERPDGSRVAVPLHDLPSVKGLVRQWAEDFTKEDADRGQTDRRRN